MKKAFFPLMIVILLALVACSPSVQPAHDASKAESPDIPDQEPQQQTPLPAAPTRTPPVPTSTPDLSLMTVNVLTSRSPDGQWKAEALLADPYTPQGTFVGNMDYATLSVYRLDGSQQWTPYEVWSETGLGDSYISDFYWSPDGRYTYFTHKGAADGCGNPFVTNLRRVDLQNGTLSEISLTDLGLDVITVSPDVDGMAYRMEEGFVVQDLETDERWTVPYEWPPGLDYVVGSYAWSPDRTELAFTLNYSYCIPSEDTRTSMRVIDLESGEARTLADLDPPLLFVIGWPEPGTLQVYQDGGRYLFAVDSGELTPLPPDPVSEATVVLQDYLNSLYRGTLEPSLPFLYERAAELYGGSYETLMEMNPDIDPTDKPALLSNACEVNGFECLRVREIISVEFATQEDGARELLFTVNLLNSDGSVFTLAPPDVTGEPQSEFVFTVKQLEDGAFKVLDLPPFMP